MATSINIPALNNTIRTDVPAINAVIKALAKNDPSVLTDLESGTKRIIEGSSGWEIQQYNGTSWVTLSKFNINAQQVDGFDASASVVANSIPVRNAQGDIPGNITGNAPTADKLNATLGVDAGGTGATTPANARTNLGVPPISHDSTATTYGIGTSTNYGHVKLSDAADSTSAASVGIAASPKAVSTGLDDLMDDVITAANNAVTGNTTLIQQVSARVDELSSNKADKFVNNKGVVRSVNGLNADGDGNVAISIPTPPVTSVNGMTGAVEVGTVKSVNGVEADAAGNVSVSLPSTYITSATISGRTHKRVYSDNFKLQAGVVTSVAQDKNYTVTFPTAFSSTPIAMAKIMASGRFWFASITSLSSTKMVINVGEMSSSGSPQEAHWIAVGK